MPIAKLADEMADRRRRVRTRTELGGLSEMPPRLWPQLPAATRQQLAQRVGQLVQRLRPLSAHVREGHCVDDVER